MCGGLTCVPSGFRRFDGYSEALGSVMWALRGVAKDHAEIFELATTCFDLVTAVARMDGKGVTRAIHRFVKLSDGEYTPVTRQEDFVDQELPDFVQHLAPFIGNLDVVMQLLNATVLKGLSAPLALDDAESAAQNMMTEAQGYVESKVGEAQEAVAGAVGMVQGKIGEPLGRTVSKLLVQVC